MYYPGKYLTADNDTLTVQTATGGTALTIVDTSLGDADNYWDGAVGFFEPNTTTAALRGKYFHVRSWTLSTKTLLLYASLPAACANTDTFRLVLGGNWRSSYEIPGLTFTTPVNITGVTINYAGYQNPTGVGTLTYTNTSTSLQWTPPSGIIGSAVNVSGSGVFDIFDATTSLWVEVTVVAASLPVTDQTDAITLTQPTAIVIPNEESTEISGKIRYYAIPIKNTHASDSIYDLVAYLQKEISTAAETNTTTTLIDGGLGIATLGCTSLTNWPASGWIYNITKNDCRYYYNKSANTVRCADPGSGVRGLTSVAWAAGDSVQLMPDIDIGKGAPNGSYQFEDPANETTAPAAVTFTCPITSGTGVSFSNVANGVTVVLWVRETIVAGTRAKASVLSQVLYSFDVAP
jgi:hypothetical protein